LSCKDDDAVAKVDVLDDESRTRGNSGRWQCHHRESRAFEDTGDGRSAERGGDDNGGAREGELANLR
jgi:hypothetical protein